MKSFIVSLFLLISTSVSTKAQTQDCDLGWISLWNEEMLEWGENGNKMKAWEISVYSQPSQEKSIGKIIVRIKPGEIFRSYYQNPKQEIIEFQPDLFDQDWGY